MKSYNKGNGWLITIVVIAIVVLLVWWLWPGVDEGDINPEDNTAAVGDAIDNNSDRMRIDAASYYADGEYTIAGTVNLPTPCHTLSESVTVSESMPEQVTIAFTSTDGDADVCAQVIDERPFRVDFAASESTNITATWNGEPATLNLAPKDTLEETIDFRIEKG